MKVRCIDNKEYKGYLILNKEYEVEKFFENVFYINDEFNRIYGYKESIFEPIKVEDTIIEGIKNENINNFKDIIYYKETYNDKILKYIKENNKDIFDNAVEKVKENKYKDYKLYRCYYRNPKKVETYNFSKISKVNCKEIIFDKFYEYYREEEKFNMILSFSDMLECISNCSEKEAKLKFAEHFKSLAKELEA